MARKMTFDSSISKDIKAASADSFVDNIKMIDISDIKLSKENFYELSEIEMLADDIERQGLKHNLVVSEDKKNGSGYWLKSGHRRFTAVKLLISSGRANGTKVPCYIDGEKTQAEAKLDLIMLNATQRKYTDAEVLQEYEELKKTFQNLDDEGKGLKGRMRDNIATALKVSPAQVAKIENIKHNAVPEVAKAIDSGKVSISAANEIAKLEPEQQKEFIANKTEKSITHKAIKEFKEAKSSAAAEQKNDTERKCATYSTDERTQEIEDLIRLLENDPIYDFLGGEDGDEIIFDGDKATDLIIAALQSYKTNLLKGEN